AVPRLEPRLACLARLLAIHHVSLVQAVAPKTAKNALRGCPPGLQRKAFFTAHFANPCSGSLPRPSRRTQECHSSLTRPRLPLRACRPTAPYNDPKALLRGSPHAGTHCLPGHHLR